MCKLTKQRMYFYKEYQPTKAIFTFIITHGSKYTHNMNLIKQKKKTPFHFSLNKNKNEQKKKKIQLKNAFSSKFNFTANTCRHLKFSFHICTFIFQFAALTTFLSNWCAVYQNFWILKELKIFENFVIYYSTLVH